MPEETKVVRAMSFVESAKGILTIAGMLLSAGIVFAGWVSQHLVFAGDLAKQSQKFEVQQVESNERLARYQRQELENRIFLLDSKSTTRPQDVALRNRYKNQLDEVNRDLRNLERRKQELRQK